MKSKKLAALLTVTVLGMSMTAAPVFAEETTAAETAAEETSAAETEAGAEETSGAEETAETAAAEGTTVSDEILEKMTNGYYTYSYEVEGLGDMYNYFHFYAERPVIGKVFYAGYAMNQIFHVGTYDVLEEEYSYSCYADRSAAEADTLTDGTAPYTIVLYDWDGSEIGRMGFDGDNIYNDCEAMSAVSTSNNIFAYDPDGVETGFADYYAGEVGQAYLDFVGTDDATCTLTLYHNGTYMDLVNMMVEGTWEMEEGDDGYSYTLTPDSETDTGAVLTVSADKMTAVYTPAEGDAINMTNTSQGQAAAYTLTGQFELAGMTADLTCSAYDDNTVKVVSSMSGAEMEIDAGTYEITEDYNFLMHFDKVGDIQSAMEGEDVLLQYTCTGTDIGDLDVTLSLVKE